MNELIVQNEANTPMSVIDILDMETVQTTIKKINSFQAVIQATLKENKDYGKVPGSTKPSLLKPGGEKITMLMGIVPTYEIMESTEDFKNEFFNYDIRCRLLKNNQQVSEGVGSCNSKEKKYRYMWVTEDKLPAGINKDSLETEIRYNKTQYRIENPEVCSLANTILKMAKKRAFIDAVLQVASLSEIFTQDIEDLEDFNKSETNDTMTLKEAAAMKMPFGKHKGSTLRDIFNDNHDYVVWFLEKGTDPTIKKAFQMMQDYAQQQIAGAKAEIQNNSPKNTTASTASSAGNTVKTNNKATSNGPKQDLRERVITAKEADPPPGHPKDNGFYNQEPPPEPGYNDFFNDTGETLPF